MYDRLTTGIVYVVEELPVVLPCRFGLRGVLVMCFGGYPRVSCHYRPRTSRNMVLDVRRRYVCARPVVVSLPAATHGAKQPCSMPFHPVYPLANESRTDS
jgi:hypothetical protein